MVYLPFHSSKHFKFFVVFIFSLLCFNALLYAQVKIKEKVIINPQKSGTVINKSVQDYPPLEFQIGGAIPFTTTVSGPAESVSGAGGGGTNPYVILNLSALNGIYTIRISSTL